MHVLGGDSEPLGDPPVDKSLQDVPEDKTRVSLQVAGGGTLIKTPQATCVRLRDLRIPEMWQAPSRINP